MSGDIYGHHDGGTPGIQWAGLGMPPHTPRHPGRPTENDRALNVSTGVGRTPEEVSETEPRARRAGPGRLGVWGGETCPSRNSRACSPLQPPVIGVEGALPARPLGILGRVSCYKRAPSPLAVPPSPGRASTPFQYGFLPWGLNPTCRPHRKEGGLFSTGADDLSLLTD